MSYTKITEADYMPLPVKLNLGTVPNFIQTSNGNYIDVADIDERLLLRYAQRWKKELIARSRRRKVEQSKQKP